MPSTYETTTDLAPPPALTSFHAAFTPELLAFAMGRGATREDAEDMVQQVWTAFAKTSESQAIGAPRAWLYLALRNGITDGYRRRATQPLIIPLETNGFGESRTEIRLELGATAFHRLGSSSQEIDVAAGDLDATEFWSRVDAALAELPRLQAETFRRNVIVGESLLVIAASHGVPVRTAISRKRYARERLEGLLGDLYEDYFGEQ